MADRRTREWSDEPCLCGTDFTCMAEVHDPTQIVGDEAGGRTVILPGPLPSHGPRVDRGPGHEAE